MPAQPTELTARLIDIFGNPLTADPTKLYGNLTVNTDGTIGIGTGITMPDGFTHAITPSGRNKIINGDAKVAQRPSVTSTNGAPLYGGPDRFWFATVGATGLFTQSAGTMTIGSLSRGCVTQTITASGSSFTAGNYVSGIVQKIEGTNAYELLGGPVTVSFWFNGNVSGTYSVTLQDGTQANSCTKTFSYTSGAPAKVALTFPSLPLTLAVPNTNAVGLFLWIGMINQGNYQTSTLNAWQSGNYISASTQTNWAASNANFISVTDLQLEAGNYATPFERLLYQQQFQNCLRYYERLNQGNYGVGSMNSATLGYVVVPFQGVKRAAPSVSGSAANTFYLYCGNGNATPTAISWPTVTLRQALASVTITSISSTVGSGCVLEDQTGNSYIEFISEI